MFNQGQIVRHKLSPRVHFLVLGQLSPGNYVLRVAAGEVLDLSQVVVLNEIELEGVEDEGGERIPEAEDYDWENTPELGIDDTRKT